VLVAEVDSSPAALASVGDLIIAIWDRRAIPRWRSHARFAWDG
jgi:hypothetical protein